MSLELTIDLKMGPVSIQYKAPEGAELFWTDEAKFMQMMMNIIRHVGTQDDPPEDPNPPVTRQPSTFPQTPVFRESITVPGSLGVGDVPVNQTEKVEEPSIDSFFDDDDDVGEVPQGSVVGRVAPVKEVKVSE